MSCIMINVFGKKFVEQKLFVTVCKFKWSHKEKIANIQQKCDSSTKICPKSLQPCFLSVILFNLVIISNINLTVVAGRVVK